MPTGAFHGVLAALTPGEAQCGGPGWGRRGTYPPPLPHDDKETKMRRCCYPTRAPPSRKKPSLRVSCPPPSSSMPSQQTQTLSGNISKQVLTGSRQPNLEDLKRRTMSCRVAATTKYSCFRRSSFPSKNYRNKTAPSPTQTLRLIQALRGPLRPKIGIRLRVGGILPQGPQRCVCG